MCSDRSRLIFAVALTCALASSAASAPVLFDAVAPSTLRFHLSHKFHEVDGTSRQVEGKARLLPDGTVQLMARAPVSSFDSGNSNRDAHMLEVLEAEKYPFVTLKAVGHGVTLPATFPAQQTLPVEAELTFHGVTQPMTLPVELAWSAPGKVTARAKFPVSLTAFHIQRPELAFIPVNDQISITAQLDFSEAQR